MWKKSDMTLQFLEKQKTRKVEWFLGSFGSSFFADDFLLHPDKGNDTKHLKNKKRLGIWNRWKRVYEKMASGTV